MRMRPKRFRATRTRFEKLTWQEYQERLKKTAASSKKLSARLRERAVQSVLSGRPRPNFRAAHNGYAAVLRRLNPSFLKLSLIFALLLIGVYGITRTVLKITGPPSSSKRSITTKGASTTPQPDKQLFDKKDVRRLLNAEDFFDLTDKGFDVMVDGQRLRVETSLDISLQHYIQEKLNWRTPRYRPDRIGIVAVDPMSGRVLCLVGFEETPSAINPCVDNGFPAASIFKIVTAAAAVEEFGFDADTRMAFNGQKHTLYKSQLRNRQNKYTRTLTLRDSFAQSVNPVFGKIGVHYLGRSILEKYAAVFGFNRPIDFEIPLAPSVFSVSDKLYHWAEIASGFNRQTTMSPLHGALMAAAVINQGTLMEPTIIDRISDATGRLRYQGRCTPLRQAITPEASHVLSELMQATVTSGTSRKTFRGYRRDEVLSRLVIGGKTGSINNSSNDARFDWFVGFAEEKNGLPKIAVAVVVAHGKYIGTRASQYARWVIQEYFRNYFAGIQATSAAAGS
ncbi:MAG: PbpA [Desulfobacterales bacterium]|nr:MAG: PbpA [Desulfobacterales bacterium]